MRACVAARGARRLPAAEGGRPSGPPPALLCALLAVICFANTLPAGFVYDDSRAVVQNADVRGRTPLSALLVHDFWGTPLRHAGSHGSYRPLAVLTFRLTHALVGLRPALHHAINVLLHAGCSALVAAAAAELGLSERAARLAGALFAVHPVHCEAVAGLVGRADLLSLLCTLGTLLCYSRQARRCAEAAACGSSPQRRPEWRCAGGAERSSCWWAGCLVCASLALLSKEQGIAALPLCLLYELCVLNRSRLCQIINMQSKNPAVQRAQHSCLLLTTAAGALLAARLSLLHGQLPWFAAADNPLPQLRSRRARALTLLQLPAAAAQLLLWPHRLSYDWSAAALPPVLGVGDVRNVSAAALYAAVAALLLSCWRQLARSRAAGAALCWLLFAVVAYLPASNVLFYVGFLLAERTLYAPSVAACVLVGCGAARLRRRWPRVVPVLSWGLVAVLAMRTLTRNGDWRSERALYTAGIPYSPAKSLGNLATILADQGRLDEAERAYRAALSQQYNMADFHYNLGNLLYSQGKYGEARTCYRDAVGFRQHFAQAYLNLALTEVRLSEHDSAGRVLRTCQSLPEHRTRHPRAHRAARAACATELGRLEAEHWRRPATAAQQYLFALQIAPDDHNPETIYNLMGEVQYGMDNYDDAERWFQRAAHVQPSSVHAHLFYGKMIAKNKSRLDEAEAWFQRARGAAPDDVNVHLHYGQFLYESGRRRESAEAYTRAVQLSPLDYDLTFNLANIYRELGRYDSAELYYRRATQIRPQDAHSHRNLGALLHVRGDFDRAEASYLTALQLRPGDHVTEVNLARLRRLQKRHAPPRSAGAPARNGT